MRKHNIFLGLAILAASLLILPGLCSGDEWFQGYVVSGPYSGPTQFQVENYRYQYLTSDLYNNPQPKEDWQFGLTPREFVSKVWPSLDLAMTSAIHLTTLKAGNYSMGIVQAFSTAEEDYQPKSETPFFVTNGKEFRSSSTTPVFDQSIGMADWAWNLNEKGQFLFLATENPFVYDFATADLKALPSLGIGTNEFLWPKGIDNEGTIVGNVTAKDTQGNYIQRPFRYSGGVMTDLNDLVKLNDELLLINAYDLTETGEIIARMQNTWSGQEDWVKLTPAIVPEPSGLIIGITGILATAWHLRKHRKSLLD